MSKLTVKFGGPSQTYSEAVSEAVSPSDQITPHGIQREALSEGASPADAVQGSVNLAPSGDHPNEPSGFTTITERQFSQTVEDDWKVFGGSEDPDAGAFRIETDNTAPESPSDIGVARYPAGHEGGLATIHVARVFDADGVTPRQMVEVYSHFWFKFSSNWQQHPDSLNSKMIFVKGNQTDHLNSPFFSAHGDPEMHFQVRTQSTEFSPRNLGGNLDFDASRLVRGQWHEIEVHLVMNSADGVGDGECHVWIDGTKTHEYTDVVFGDPNQAMAWDYWAWNGTWGGVGGTVDELMHQYMDHVYISGLPEPA